MEKIIKITGSELISKCGTAGWKRYCYIVGKSSSGVIDKEIVMDEKMAIKIGLVNGVSK